MRLRAFKLGLSLAAISFLCLLPHVHADNEVQIIIKKPLIGEFFKIQSDVEIAGTATPGSEITLSTNEGEYAKIQTDKDGNWSYTIPTVSEGTQTIQAKATKEIDALSSKSAIANVSFIVGNQESSSQIQSLAQTGILLGLAIPIGLLLIVATIYAYFDYRKHKRPLQKADPKVNYTFWHHLRLVSIPVLKYRLSINVYKRAPNRSENIRRY